MGRRLKVGSVNNQVEGKPQGREKKEDAETETKANRNRRGWKVKADASVDPWIHCRHFPLCPISPSANQSSPSANQSSPSANQSVTVQSSPAQSSPVQSSPSSSPQVPFDLQISLVSETAACTVAVSEKTAQVESPFQIDPWLLQQLEFTASLNFSTS